MPAAAPKKSQPPLAEADEQTKRRRISQLDEISLQPAFLLNRQVRGIQRDDMTKRESPAGPPHRRKRHPRLAKTAPDLLVEDADPAAQLPFLSPRADALPILPDPVFRQRLGP